MPDLDAIAARHGVGPDAVRHLLDALARGHGRMAQFNHPDLGGMGQWSAGGMTMIGDMFNSGLKARVVALCDELAPLATGENQGSGWGSSQSQGSGSGGSWNQSGVDPGAAPGGRTVSASRRPPARRTTRVTPSSPNPAAWRSRPAAG